MDRVSAPQGPETPARASLDRMHAQIKSGDYLAAQTHALAAIAEALVQMVEPAQNQDPYPQCEKCQHPQDAFGYFCRYFGCRCTNSHRMGGTR